MIRELLNSKVDIYKTNNDLVKSGCLTIKAFETINIDSITGFVFFYTRGMISGEKEELLSFKISNKKIVRKNETSKISFSFELPPNSISTYKGKNVSFSYKCEVEIVLKNEDIEKNNKNIFSNHFLLPSEETLKSFAYFNVEDLASLSYQVKETSLNFVLEKNWSILIFITVILELLYIYLLPELTISYLILGVMIGMFMANLFYEFVIRVYLENVIGGVCLEIIRGEDFILCKIDKSNRIDLSLFQSIYYEIIERVIDNRGTTSNTYKEIVYISSQKNLSGFKENSILKLDYPEIKNLHSKNLHSKNYGYTSIIWMMNLEVKYFFLRLHYKAEFKVEK